MEDLSWLPPSFQILNRSGGYISGIVNSEEELRTLLENHKTATLTSFNKWSDTVKDSSKLRRLWQVEDYSEDTPLCVTKRVILTCHHGKAPCRRPSTANTEASLEHACKKKRIRKGKKLDCPAKLFIRHVMRYDTFSVKGDASRARKEDAMKRLKQELAQRNPPTSTFIHVKIPLVEAHQNHTMDSGCCFSKHIRPKARDKIQEMAGLGITSVTFVERALEQNVLTDSCKSYKEDQHYFPVRLHISKLELEPFGREEEVYSTGAEQEVGGNSNDDTFSSLLPGLQLDEAHSNSEDTVVSQEVTIYSDEAARKERKKLLKELNAIRMLSNMCTDAAKLVKLKAGIKALHGKFKNSLQEPPLSPSASARTRAPKRKNTTALPTTKTVQRDNMDHEY
ncbi:calcium-responsive transcription factor isoform X1 [Chaetodon trifascialis]|uniref:calcium-responsive transcription factor isoform X1 n=1 Tax=Chaetodon trifascialis TaxID=109706 RepID=UPI003994E16D